jgi:1-acyl-sn-glycerol-3-phosphate acyltransferase
MRPLYFIFWLGLGFSFRLFFRRIREVRPSRTLFGRTIFVSNHPSAFLDPLVISRLRTPVVYFMTRSDVFNWFTKPLFWLAQMIPIYRAQDGGNSQEKNKKVFKKATQTLAKKRNLLIFGEGLTDDVFERRLKPIKKGAIRIGFTALEDLDWKYEIQVQGLGINYTNPGILRSEVLIAAAEPIVLNDYKEAYLENPSKVISELNRALENRMQAQITHLRSEEHLQLHEQIMMLNRKGMHVHCYDKQYTLEQRWAYSQQLAERLNNDQTLDLTTFRNEMLAYHKHLENQGLNEAELYWFAIEKNWRLKTFCKWLIQLPMFPIGLPTYFVKRFVEKKMKRRVFWSSTKMAMLLVILTFWNLFLFKMASLYICLSTTVWFALFLSMNIVALGYYLFGKNTTLLLKSLRYNAQKLHAIVQQRKELLTQIETFQF